MSLPVTRSRVGLLALVATLVWWVFFKKFPCPYCDGRGWNWEPKRHVWYVVSCEKCQTKREEWSTGIPIGDEGNRVVGDREQQT
jgi:hypothetical protein